MVARDQVTIVGMKVKDLTARGDRGGSLERMAALVSGEIDELMVEKQYVKPGGEIVRARLESVAKRSESGTYLLSLTTPITTEDPDLQRQIDQLRSLISGLTGTQKVTVNMGSTEINADNGANVSSGNQSNDTKVFVVGAICCAVVAIAVAVLVFGGRAKLDKETIEVESRPAIMQEQGSGE